MHEETPGFRPGPRASYDVGSNICQALAPGPSNPTPPVPKQAAPRGGGGGRGPAPRITGMGFHTSTFQLNLSHICR